MDGSARFRKSAIRCLTAEIRPPAPLGKGYGKGYGPISAMSRLPTWTRNLLRYNRFREWVAWGSNPEPTDYKVAKALSAREGNR